jgi:hypothetical protein
MCFRIFTMALFSCAVILVGCAGLTPDTYKGYVGEDASRSEVAIVEAATAAIYEINGHELKHPDPGQYYRQVYLPPGEHTIKLYRWFGVSALIVSKGFIEVVSQPLSVNLKAGHTYELHADRTTGVIRVILWVEDSSTGEIVAREADPQLLQ